MQAATQARRISEINITPLIDIVLVLLIVFIVMVPMADRAHYAIIPHESREVPKQAPPPEVMLDSMGRCSFEGRVWAKQDLLAAIREQVGYQPIDQRRVTLKADGSLSMQRVAETIDLLKAAGDQAEQENRLTPSLAKAEFKPLKVVLLPLK